jgi:sugar/nucleoside kinase (ribokinase family)
MKPKGEKKFDVIGVGLSAVDYLCVLPFYPPYNSKTRILRLERQPGGQVATALVALSRWGLKTAYVGKLGMDEPSRFSLAELEKEGVDISRVVVSEEASAQIAFIVIDTEMGERTIFWHRRKESDLRPSEIDPDFVRSGSVLLVDGHEEGSLLAARASREAGIPVVLDADHVDEKSADLIASTDVLIASLSFFEQMPWAKGSLENQLRKIRAMGPKVAAATLGKDGSLALAGSQWIRTPGYPVKAEDTTGAGDIFHAAYIYGCLQGWQKPEIFEFSNAMAALKCRKLGGRPGIASLSECAEFRKKCGR